ncbi:MAG: hypothetical protein H7240_11050 [Glaciimonas sp.]|nr:hypothetical protein [Glaciimonas sp.]
MIAVRKKGLVYLNRKAEGIKPVQRFIDSYKNFDPGVKHEFITIYKGFGAAEKAIAESFFNGIEHRQIVVDDEMTDIDAYLIAAESFPDIDAFCFLNTFSEIVCNNWLVILYDALSSENVGIAGATASYESLLNSNKLISKVLWLAGGVLKYEKKLHLQYESIIKRHYPNWIRWGVASRFLPILRNKTSDNNYLNMYDAMFEEYWGSLTKHNGAYEFLIGYPPFPNPHIRSNGFVIRRRHLLPFFDKSRRMSKNESYLFESGAKSLTRQLIKSQLRAVVVNSAGNIYDVEEWPRSQTFRLDIQQGLLVQDNQTRSFQKLNSAEKDVNEFMSWGDSSRKISDRVFTFGIPFDIENKLI